MNGVEVVLCTYDGASFLDAQLQSLAQQTHPVDRVVVSDDASGDATLQIVAAHSGTLPIELRVNAATLGAVANFQAALRRSRAELVFLCDQDDVWHADKVATMTAAARTNPQCWVIHSDGRIVDEKGRATGQTLSRSLRWPDAGGSGSLEGEFLPLLRRNFVTGATIAIRRELLDVALPVPDGYWHDEWLALMAAAAGRLCRLDAALIDYRIHASNHAGLRGVRFLSRLDAMTSPRGDHHELRSRKMEALLDRLQTLRIRVPPERLRAVEECARHWASRASLSGSRLARARVVASEFVAGRYGMFSSGWRSALRDLVEPLP